MIKQRGKRLGKLLSGTDGAFLYEYDFGDGWTHGVERDDSLAPRPRRLSSAAVG